MRGRLASQPLSADCIPRRSTFARPAATPLPGVALPATRCAVRPSHYLVVTRWVDWASCDDDAEPEVTYVVEPYRDERAARDHAADDDAAVFDNWSGSWVGDAPDWAGDVAILAEGHARYDLRPAGGAR